MSLQLSHENIIICSLLGFASTSVLASNKPARKPASETLCGQLVIDYNLIDKAEGGSGKTEIVYNVQEFPIDRAEGGSGEPRKTVLKAGSKDAAKKLRKLEEDADYCFTGSYTGSEFVFSSVKPK